MCSHWSFAIVAAPQQPLDIIVGQASLITKVTELQAWRAAGTFTSTRHTFVLINPLDFQDTMYLMNLLATQVSQVTALLTLAHHSQYILLHYAMALQARSPAMCNIRIAIWQHDDSSDKLEQYTDHFEIHQTIYNNHLELQLKFILLRPLADAPCLAHQSLFHLGAP